jgi:peptide/nickel transport system permease protein
VASALYRDTLLDRLLLDVAGAGQAVPPFLLGLLLINVFSLQLHLLPTSGTGTPLHLIMPTVTLAAFMIAGLYRLTRSSMLDVLDAEYVKFARIKGLSEMRVIVVHALRNALLAPVTFLSLYAGLLLGGSVIVETVFNWPGLGSLAVLATLSRDLPVMQAVVLVTATFMVFTTLLSDLVYFFIDPRIRY